VDDDVAVRDAIDRLLPERLWRLRRVTGVPVAFGGPVTSASGRQIVVTRAYGTLGDSLQGLRVAPGQGLGGVVLRDGGPGYVSDYATATTITHDFDDIVVARERLTSVFALPVMARGAVRGVLYGAVRGPAPLGDRAIRAASVVATQFQHDLNDESRAALSRGRGARQPALAELASLIHLVGDPGLRARLIRVHRALAGEAAPPGPGQPRADAAPPAGTGFPETGAGSETGAVGQGLAAVLAPRERDVLRIAAIGASNMEIAAQLGLSPQTVKAYMRGAMRKLGVHNRTAALHAARLADALLRHSAGTLQDTLPRRVVKRFSRGARQGSITLRKTSAVPTRASGSDTRAAVRAWALNARAAMLSWWRVDDREPSPHSSTSPHPDSRARPTIARTPSSARYSSPGTATADRHAPAPTPVFSTSPRSWTCAPRMASDRALSPSSVSTLTSHPAIAWSNSQPPAYRTTSATSRPTAATRSFGISRLSISSCRLRWLTTVALAITN
jgi:LuxR family transcriptional regulator, regulator of acetate metabolism